MAEQGDGAGAPPEGQPGGTPGTPGAPPPEGGAGGAPPPPEGAISFPTKEAFEKRMDQAVRAQLRKLGIEDPKAAVEELSRLRTEDEARKKAALTEQERLQAEAAAAKKEAEEAKATAAAAQKHARTSEIAASLGIRNLSYLRFKMDTATPEELEDAEGFVKGLLEKPLERAALVPSAAPPPEGRPGAPATTAPGSGGAPPPPPAGGAPPAVKDAFSLTADEWARRKAELGLP